jgi:hypothetical protein
LELRETGFNSTLYETCVSYEGLMVLEDMAPFDDFPLLLKKSESCGQVYMPKSLNIVGQLDGGEMHWH